MTQDERDIQLSDLEARILETIDNIGWCAYLWFPVVSRAALNFGSNASDEEVHAAVTGLVRKGALVFVPEETPEKEWTSIPQWRPEPIVLEKAKKIR